LQRCWERSKAFPMCHPLLVCPGPSPPRTPGGDGTGLAREAPPFPFAGDAETFHGVEGTKAAGPSPCQARYLARFLSSMSATKATVPLMNSTSGHLHEPSGERSGQIGTGLLAGEARITGMPCIPRLSNRRSTDRSRAAQEGCGRRLVQRTSGESHSPFRLKFKTAGPHGLFQP